MLKGEVCGPKIGKLGCLASGGCRSPDEKSHVGVLVVEAAIAEGGSLKQLLSHWESNSWKQGVRPQVRGQGWKAYQRIG